MKANLADASSIIFSRQFNSSPSFRTRRDRQTHTGNYNCGRVDMFPPTPTPGSEEQMRIDAHQHFWQYNPVEHSWMTEEMGGLRRNFMPPDLKPLLASLQFRRLHPRSGSPESRRDAVAARPGRPSTISSAVWSAGSICDRRIWTSQLEQFAHQKESGRCPPYRPG